MKKIIGLFFLYFIVSFCNAQQSNSNEKVKPVIEKIVKDTCLCFNENSNRTENYIDKLLLRECLEESAGKNLSELLKHYNIKSFKEIDLKKFLEDLKLKLAKRCKSNEAFIEESFKLISLD